MEKKTIIIDVQTDEGVKSLNRLEASFEDVYGEVQPLSGRLGELEDQLYEMANAGDTSSDAFKALSAEVGRMKKVIMEVDLEVDALSMTTANKLGGALGGITSGFELAQGAMGAMGAESERVEEALLKVQSAMAIAQGVQGIKESIPSFIALRNAIASTAVGQKLLASTSLLAAGAMKVLNFVMSLNPVLLIVTGITALVGAFAWLFSSTEKATEANERLNDSIDRQNKKFEENQEKITKNADNRRRLLEANGATEEQLHQDTLRRLEEEEKGRKKNMSMLDSQIKSRIKLLKRAQEEENEDLAKDIKEKIEADRQKFEQLKLQNKEYYIAVKEENKRFKDLEDQERKAEEEKNKQIAEKRREERKRQNEEARKQQEELNKLIIQAKNEELAKIEELDEQIYQSKLSAQEKEIIALNDYYFEKIELAKQYGLDYQALEEERNKKAAEINNRYEEERARKVAEIVQKVNEERKKQDDYDKQKAEEKRQRDEQYFELSKQTLTTFSELVDAFAGQDEASQKRAFKIKKAASIAQTTIETYQASQSAYASQMAIPTPDAPIRAAVAAGIAIASGLARVKAIASQQFSGGGSSSSAGGGGGVSLPSAGSSATFNVVGNSNTNQIVEGINANPVQAYVVAGEVTTAQNLDRNRIKTATL